MYKRVLLFFTILILLQSELLSQQYYFKKYSVEEGLPNSSVFCLMQDSRGYIWIGTVGGGVTMFDGFRYVNYSTDNGLTDNVVRTLLEDTRGNIWIGTDNGVTIYNGETFTPLTRETGLAGTSVLKLLEDKRGTIWIGTNDGGLSAVRLTDSLSVTSFSMEDGLYSDFIYDIIQASDNKFWLAVYGAVNVIEFSESDSLYIKNIDTPLQASDLVLSIVQQKDGSMLIGTRYDGLFIARPGENGYDIAPSPINDNYSEFTIWDILVRPDNEVWLATDQNGVIRLYDGKVKGSFNKENGLPSNRIMNILYDDEGNSWFATLDKGAIMFRDEKFITYGTREGIPGNQVVNVFFDDNNMLYTATEEGFTCFEKKGEVIRKTKFFSLAEGLNDVGANTITRRNNEIWIGTAKGINIYNGSRLYEFSRNNDLPSLKINCFLADRNGAIWIGTDGGFAKLSGDTLNYMSQDDSLIHNEVQTIIEDSRGRIWMGTMGGLVKLENKMYSDYDKKDGLTLLRINCLAEDPAGNIWIGTFGGGIFKFDIEKTEMPISILATDGTLSSNNINSLHFLNDTSVITGTDKGFDLIVLDKNQTIKRTIHYGMDDGFTGGENLPNSVAVDNEGYVWFGTKNGLVKFAPGIKVDYNQLPRTFFSGIKLFYKDVDWKSKNVKTSRWSGMPQNLVLSHKDNHLTFLITGFFYSNPGDLMFSSFLDPQYKEWSPYSTDREIQFASLSPGNYTVKVRAKNKYGIISEGEEYNFSIKPPFYMTKGFIISSVIALLLLIFTFFRMREKNLISEKIKLESIVKERTREVVEQKDEIEKQRDLVTVQKKEIMDSINYAERIQQAVLPDDSVLGDVFSDYFIILRPKDVVSGDFYWMTVKNGRLIFAAADCTGHGVPGAFMSMLGVSFLNKIVNESGITEPSAILNSLRENIIGALKQRGTIEDAKDGMDMSLCGVDQNLKKLWFAGANNPLYMIRKENGEFIFTEKRGDMMPVGVYSNMSNFRCHEIDIQKGDTFYLFSDGFMDQFGGPEGRKFMKTRFRQMLIDNQEADMASQKEIFNKTLDDWINYPSENKQQIGQVDDIILMGVRV